MLKRDRVTGEERSNCSGEMAKLVTQASVSKGEEHWLTLGMKLEGEDKMVPGITA